MARNSGRTSINGGQDREEGEELSNRAFLTQFMKIQQESARIQQQNCASVKLLTEGQLILKQETRNLSANVTEHEARLRALERQAAGQNRDPLDNWTPLTPAHDEQDDESEDYVRFVPNRRRYFKSNMTRIPGPTGPSSDRYICPRCKKHYANSYILLHVNKGTCVEQRVAP